jgi:hypothetical protein
VKTFGSVRPACASMDARYPTLPNPDQKDGCIRSDIWSKRADPSRSTTARGSFKATVFCLSTHTSFYDPHEPGI